MGHIVERTVVRQVDQIEESIREVPIPRFEEEIVQRQVPSRKTVQKFVDVPQVEEHVIPQPVEMLTEDIVEVPKIEVHEEVVECPIEVILNRPKQVEVPQTFEHIVERIGDRGGSPNVK